MLIKSNLGLKKPTLHTLIIINKNIKKGECENKMNPIKWSIVFALKATKTVDNTRG